MRRTLRLQINLVVGIIFALQVSVLAQPFTIVQNVTGSSRTDIRGQSFRAANQGSGTGTLTTSESFVFLNSIAFVFAGGAEPSTLYIYSTLAPTITELDNGSYGNLVTQSTSKTTDFPYTVYHFDEAPILKEGRYYAVFRQNVQLEFGSTANNNIGPYNGGAMIINDGTAPVQNDYTDLRFVVKLENSNNQSYQKDVAALTALHQATNGASWTNKWDLTTDPKTWQGVQWSYNRVWYLDLRNNNLTGILPKELGNLTRLRDLRLSENNIGGTIPTELGNLKELSNFYLNKNKLTGSIPSSLGNLTNVEYFYLSSNLLTGTIPAELGNLTKVRGLTLGGNKLTGTVPASFGNLTSLTQLHLYGNELQGALPAQLANLTATQIDLDNNYYNFGSFEPLATFLSLLPSVSLTPQAALPVEDNFKLTELGGSLTLTISTPGTNNRYQWYRGATAVSTVSASPDLALTNFQSNMTGKYTCRVTNTTLPNLTLTSAEITVDHPLVFSASVSEEKATSVRLSTQFSHAGPVYYIITTGSAPAPTAAQVIAGTDGNNQTPVKNGNHILQNQNTVITGLAPNNSYKVYYVGRTSLQQGEVKNLSFTTLPGILFESTYPKIADVNAQQIKIALKTTLAGTAYYVALPYGSAAPTAIQVAAKQDATGNATPIGGSATLTATTELVVTVSGLNHQTVYDIYVTAKDAEGLHTAVHKLEVETITSVHEQISVRIFPNPVNDHVFIENNSNTTLNIRIVDTLGRELHSQTGVSIHNEIDTRGWQSGLYLVEVKTLTGTNRVKLLKN